MITVKEIKLPLRIPSASVHMVFMQPYIEFEIPHREPYKWSQQARGDIECMQSSILWKLL